MFSVPEKDMTKEPIQWGPGRICAVLLTTIFLTGCAVPIDKKATSLDLSKESIVVISMKMTNAYRPAFKPTTLGMAVSSRIEKSPPAQSAPVGQTVPPYASTQKRGQANVTFPDNEALVLLRLPPGPYKLSRLWGMTIKFPIQAEMSYAVNADFNVPPQAVVYLGHLDIVNKERIDKDDQASGFAIPLIDQAVAGFSGGTLGVALSDHYERDIGMFRAEYPVTMNVPVVRAPLFSMMLERATGSDAFPVKVLKAP